ncbi:unnamed protein product [Auanema sp. JU1783]|nr:unnamed protein product [Auanema sp. JU1783]
MGSAVAFVIFGKDNNRLYSAVNDKWQKFLYDIELFVMCSMDIIDEKAQKANEKYLGSLFNDQKYKSFGFISNTNLKMILVLEVQNNSIKDQDIRAIFQKFHSQYCNAISNPFYTFGTEIKSKYLDDAASSIFVNNTVS